MNVALVKLSALGDVVHALPVAAALRRAFPSARLTWIVERRESVLLDGHPLLDAVVTVDTRRWRHARRPAAILAAVRELRELRARLRGARFDVAVDLQGNLKSGVLTGLTGARRRIGFSARRCREPLNALFTNRRVTPPPTARHVIEQYLALIAPLGVERPAVEFHLPSDAAAEARIDEFLAAWGLKARDRLVVLNPGAGRAAKRWPTARFRELAARVVAEHAARVVVVWGPGDLAVARVIAEGGARSGVVLAPPTDLAELIALLRRTSVLVAGDTGPLHLAAALRTRCVGLYGPTRAVRNGPWGRGQRALQSPDGRMASLEVDPVRRAVEDLLG